MESRPATMAKAARATPPRGSSLPEEIAIWEILRGLPDEIVVWEILVRLTPKSLLRCRAVNRAWRCATSDRDFLLAHHARQPSLPIVSGSEHVAPRYEDILAFDHRTTDAQLQPVARIDGSFSVDASCDGLLVLSKYGTTAGSACLSICNPVTREHAPLVYLSFFSLLAMYMHRPTGEYRLLLHRMSPRGSFAGSLLPRGEIGCYILALGSDQPPSYIQGPEAAAGLHCSTFALVRDSLHWFPVHHQSESRPLLVFDTTTESFRQMGAPVVPTWSYITEMDDTLGIYRYNDGLKVVDIWVLQNYETEVWAYKYNVKLPVAEIRGQFGGWHDHWFVSVDGDLLLVSHGGRMFYVNTDGELVGSFHRDGQSTYVCVLRLKQTLVPHNLFTALEGCAVNASPFL